MKLLIRLFVRQSKACYLQQTFSLPLISVIQEPELEAFSKISKEKAFYAVVRSYSAGNLQCIKKWDRSFVICVVPSTLFCLVSQFIEGLK